MSGIAGWLDGLDEAVAAAAARAAAEAGHQRRQVTSGGRSAAEAGRQQMNHQQQESTSRSTCVVSSNVHNDETAKRRCYAFIDVPKFPWSLPLVPDDSAEVLLLLQILVITSRSQKPA